MLKEYININRNVNDVQSLSDKNTRIYKPRFCRIYLLGIYLPLRTVKNSG